jgi:hypothetical protein
MKATDKKHRDFTVHMHNLGLPVGFYFTRKNDKKGEGGCGCLLVGVLCDG